METATDINILIVEDEFLVALQLEDILVDAGFRVIGMISDRASLSRLPEAPHVALVDVNLRDGPTGPLIAQDLSRDFATKIIYVTANPQQIGAPVPTAIGIVQKPFSSPAIIAAVEFAWRGGALASLPIEVEVISTAA